MQIEWVVTVAAEDDLPPEQRQALNEVRRMIAKEVAEND